MTVEKKRVLVRTGIIVGALVLLMLVFLCVRNAGNKNTTTEDPNANQPQGVEVSSEVEIIE